MFKLLNSNRGMALPLVLVTIVIFVMFSTAILGMGTVDTKGAVQDSYKAQAYYYAHSGADAVASYIVENPDNLSAREMNDLVDSLIANGDSDPFSLSPSDGGSIVVNVSRSGNTISVRSKATYHGIQATATLNINESVSSGAPLDKAIFSKRKMEIIGQKVTGDIACLSEIELGYADIDKGKLYIHPNDDDSVVYRQHGQEGKGIPDIENLTEVFDYPVFPFPEFPGYPTGLSTYSQTLNVNNSAQINDNRYYTNGINVSNGELKIIRESTNRVIRTEYLKVSGSGQITDVRSGNGNLEIFVDDYLDLSDNTALNFSLGNGDIIIRVKRLLLNQGHIVVQRNGTGKLYIYVDDVFHIDGSSKINVPSKDEDGPLGDPKHAFVYYAGTRDKNGNDITKGEGDKNFLWLPYNIRIAATIHIKEAQIHIANGTGIVGNIISGGGKIKLDDGTNTDVKAIYAPNARVELSGGAGIKGIIVCDSFRMEGGTTVEYKPLDDEYKDMFENAIGKTEYTYGNWQ